MDYSLDPVIMLQAFAESQMSKPDILPDPLATRCEVSRLNTVIL